jgi:hypothetical protein
MIYFNSYFLILTKFFLFKFDLYDLFFLIIELIIMKFFNYFINEFFQDFIIPNQKFLLELIRLI